MALTADQEGMFTDLETEDNSEPISFEYDLNESDQKVLLGKGISFKSRVILHMYLIAWDFFSKDLDCKLSLNCPYFCHEISTLKQNLFRNPHTLLMLSDMGLK